MNIPLVDLGRETDASKQQIEVKIAAVVRRGDFVLGAEVGKFEAALAKFVGSRECVGVGSGTDGLILALRGLGIGKGDEVVTVANTFAATVAAIIHVGARPRLVDIRRDNSYLIDLDKLSKSITKNTRAIIAVHLYGQPVEMEVICRWAKKHALAVIEDAAQAIGSEYQSRRAGSWGDAGVFSFYPAKNLGAYGDGGAVVTNNEGLATKIRQLANQGQSRKYWHEWVGYNSRLDTIQAAVLRHKLTRLEAANRQRRQVANWYKAGLAGVPEVVLPLELDKRQTNWHLFVVGVPRRDELRLHLQSRGIGTGIHYPVPIP